MKCALTAWLPLLRRDRERRPVRPPQTVRNGNVLLLVGKVRRFLRQNPAFNPTNPRKSGNHDGTGNSFGAPLRGATLTTAERLLGSFRACSTCLSGSSDPRGWRYSPRNAWVPHLSARSAAEISTETSGGPQARGFAVNGSARAALTRSAARAEASLPHRGWPRLRGEMPPASL